MRNLRNALLAGTALAVILGSAANAQQATAVQQSASRLDATQFLQGSVGGVATCNTVSTTTANSKVTITPPAGQFVYVTAVDIDLTSDITGTTQVTTLSTTNITGAPFWSLATVVPTTGENGTFRQIAEHYPAGLKATTPGTAVSFVASAASFTDTILCMRVAGYFAP